MKVVFAHSRRVFFLLDEIRQFAFFWMSVIECRPVDRADVVAVVAVVALLELPAPDATGRFNLLVCNPSL